MKYLLAIVLLVSAIPAVAGEYYQNIPLGSVPKRQRLPEPPRPRQPFPPTNSFNDAVHTHSHVSR